MVPRRVSRLPRTTASADDDDTEPGGLLFVMLTCYVAARQSVAADASISSRSILLPGRRCPHRTFLIFPRAMFAPLSFTRIPRRNRRRRRGRGRRPIAANAYTCTNTRAQSVKEAKRRGETQRKSMKNGGTRNEGTTVVHG